MVYNFTSGYFEEVVEDEPLLDLLTLHSTVTLKEDLDKALHRFGLQWSDSEGQVRSDQGKGSRVEFKVCDITNKKLVTRQNKAVENKITK